MKIKFLMVFFSLLYAGAMERRDDALSLSPRFISSLLTGSKSQEKDVLLTHSLEQRRVTISFKDIFVESAFHKYEGRDGYPGIVNIDIADKLSEILISNEDLKHIITSPSSEIEYIFVGYKRGGTMASLAAWLLYKNLGQDRQIPDNLVKVIGFYPENVGDDTFCYELLRGIKQSNVIYFKSPSFFSLACHHEFPGIPIEIARSEFYRDNPVSLLCDAILFPAFITAVCFGSKYAKADNYKDRFFASLAVFVLSTCFRLILESRLNEDNVVTAYSYAAENRGLRYHLPLSEIGLIPFFSVRRGILRKIYGLF